jgi:L-threonylcarbamoyladenylate synthase
VALTYDCTDPDARVEGLAAAARAVRGGRLVVLPTDTVYGLGCDAFNPDAVRGLLAAKRRGPDMPVPVLVGSWSTIDGLVLGVPRAARDLIEAFWPGGLSLVLPHAPSLAWDLGRTKGTVMLRMPLHPVALELLRDVGPMAVSSANVSGSPPADSAPMALAQLGDSVDDRGSHRRRSPHPPRGRGDRRPGLRGAREGRPPRAVDRQARRPSSAASRAVVPTK